MLSALAGSFILCRPSLKLAKSLIISGICLGTFCSKRRLFARSITIPNFRCSRLKTRVVSSCTNPGLLWLLTNSLSLCSSSVCAVPCCLLRFCDHFLNLCYFLLKSAHTTIFSCTL